MSSTDMKGADIEPPTAFQHRPLHKAARQSFRALHEAPPMFNSLDSSRVQEERIIWQSQQKHGKVPFIVRTAFAVGSILALLIYPIRSHYWPQNRHSMTIFAFSYIVCLILGYGASELAWRRGLRLTTEDPVSQR